MVKGLRLIIVNRATRAVITPTCNINWLSFNEPAFVEGFENSATAKVRAAMEDASHHTIIIAFDADNAKK